MAKVLIGSINHDGRMDAEGAAALYCLPSNGVHACHALPKTSSLLTLNCNVLWAEAINNRKTEDNPDGFEWFALFHSDIRPSKFWIDTLIEEAEKFDADLISAVVPIKDNRGLVSTAVFENGQPWRPRFRLTLKQVHEKLPETFDKHDVLSAFGTPGYYENFPSSSRFFTLDVNTGCCLVRLDCDWANLGVYFEQNDRLAVSEKTGKWEAQTQSEDWVFSRKLSNAGGKVMATRRVCCDHFGSSSWQGGKVWGREYDTDLLGEPETNEPADAPLEKEIVA